MTEKGHYRFDSYQDKEIPGDDPNPLPAGVKLISADHLNSILKQIEDEIWNRAEVDGTIPHRGNIMAIMEKIRSFKLEDT